MERGYLILSTLPHFAAVPFALQRSMVYGVTALASTCTSIAWHWRNESYPIGILDYTLALGWGFCECWYVPTVETLVFNGGVVALNQICDRISPYWKSHSLWHLVSAAKSIWIASRLQPTPE